MSGSVPTVGVCIVTYQERFGETSAFRSILSLPEALRASLNIVSVCNSADVDEPEDAGGYYTTCGLRYREMLCRDNGGLAGGYNASLPIAIGDGADAVLFLNADAVVESWFVESLLEALTHDHDFDGFAPTLYSGASKVSPFRKRAFKHDFYIIGYLCLRVGPFVRALHFPQQFWLDGIDYWLSAELAEAGMRINVAARRVTHDLSVADHFDSLPVWRYRNILLSERVFLKSQQRLFFDLCIVYGRAFLRCLRFRRFDLANVVAKEFMAAINE
jgi:hypothetical protein